MKNLSIRARLMIWNVAAVVLLTVMLGLGVSWRVREDLVANVDRELQNRAIHRMGLPGFAPGQVPSPPPPGPDEAGGFPIMPPQGQGPMGGPPISRRPPDMKPGQWFIAQGPFRPHVFDSDLRSASQFQTDLPLDSDAARQALEGKAKLTTKMVDGESQRIMTVPIRDDGMVRVVQYAIPLSETERAIAGVNQTLFGMLPFALFLAGLGGYYLTERALRPVGSIAAAAEKVSGDNLAGRLPILGKDEFAVLAGTINSMLDRLEAAFRKLADSVEKEKRFTGDASHELRSPLTAIKANTSLALSTARGAEQYRETLVEIDRSATRMAELIDDLLILARADAGGLAGRMAHIDLEDVICASASGLREPVLDLGATQVLANRAALVRLFSNLLSNAFRHTPESGSVSISSREADGRIEIEIRDTGEGIAPEHLAHLGERFYRVDSGRARSEGGVGLGLAICKSIVEAHGDMLSIESHVGKGTTVRFSLPGNG